MPRMDQIGVLNRGWGICGFNSSLYTHSRRGSGRGKMADASARPSRMLAEIKTFMVMLEAYGRHDILQSIQDFTRAFPGFEGFTIKAYIGRIDDIVDRDRVDPGDAASYSVGLPPKAVVTYLRMVCGFPSAQKVAVDAHVQESLVGVSKKSGRTAPYKGLCHWMYELNGTIYSWGERFDSVTDANEDYVVQYRIALTG